MKILLDAMGGDNAPNSTLQGAAGALREFGDGMTIALLGENRKISNGIFTLNFYQKERCLGKVQPRMAVARFEDEQGHIISDEHRLCANSGYDRTAEYDLVVRDAEDGEELVRAPFKIDIVFGLDFDL